MDSKKINELPIAQNLGDTSVVPVSVNMGSFWQTFKLSVSALKSYILSTVRQVPTDGGGSYKYLQLVDGGDYQWSSPYNALDSVNAEDGPLDARQGKILNDNKLNKVVSSGSLQIDGAAGDDSQALYINSDGDSILQVSRDGSVKLNFDKGKTLLANLPEHADNSAAVAAGLEVHELYRTGDFVKVVHV